MKQSRFLVTCSALALAAAPALADDVKFEFGFVDHIEAGMIEQDVYVETSPGSAEVVRVTPETADEGAEVFHTAHPVRHDPMNLNAIGPYPKGASLGFSLGDWLSASGSGSYSCTGGEGHLQISFENLIPGGVYTLWHFFMPSAPTDPFIGTFDLPAGALDGSQSIFTADASGKAVFDQVLEPCLQLSGDQLVAGLAVNYHSDGQTYGVLPGDFGQNAHIQLFTALPAASEF